MITRHNSILIRGTARSSATPGGRNGWFTFSTQFRVGAYLGGALPEVSRGEKCDKSLCLIRTNPHLILCSFFALCDRCRSRISAWAGVADEAEGHIGPEAVEINGADAREQPGARGGGGMGGFVPLNSDECQLEKRWGSDCGEPSGSDQTIPS